MADYRIHIGQNNGYKAGYHIIEGVTSRASAERVAEARFPGASINVCAGQVNRPRPEKKETTQNNTYSKPSANWNDRQEAVYTPSSYSGNSGGGGSYSGGGGYSSGGGSDDGGGELIGALFGLTWWAGCTTVAATWWTASKVVYPATKWTVNRVVVPSVRFTGEKVYQGLHYVATVTAPQVWSFTQNTLAPSVARLTGDIVAWVREMVSKVLSGQRRPQSVPAQFRVETV